MITLIVSPDEFLITVASLACVPSIILGIIWIKSVELSRLAAATAAVAASTTKVIWALVRLIGSSVLLVLRDETLACLELLADMRLALSSPITEDEREVVLVPVSDAVEAELLLSSLFAQPETSNAILTIKTNQENRLFIMMLLIKC